MKGAKDGRRYDARHSIRIRFRHKSYSFRFETPSRVIVFTSDTGPFTGLVEFAKGADLLVAEANSIEQRMQDLIRSGQWQVLLLALS
jgi:ribonuclease BN (tRNA processing enzyme)